MFDYAIILGTHLSIATSRVSIVQLLEGRLIDVQYVIVGQHELISWSQRFKLAVADGRAVQKCAYALLASLIWRDRTCLPERSKNDLS